MRVSNRLLRELGIASLIISAAFGCIVSDNRCDENQLEARGTANACQCAPGYIPSPRGYGCDACGDNEEAFGVQCVCKSGFSRADASAPCEAIEGSLSGAACSAEQACSEPNPYCALSEDEPYCTTDDCSKNEDCPRDWRCVAGSGGRYCRKPAKGLLAPCESNADCEGNEATYCETLMSHMCLVEDCAADPGKCGSGWSCCDFSTLLGAALCVPSTSLANGLCYGGMSPVSP